jgi:transposase
MTDETGYGVLTDAQWAELAPLIAPGHPGRVLLRERALLGCNDELVQSIAKNAVANRFWAQPVTWVSIPEPFD